MSFTQEDLNRVLNFRRKLLTRVVIHSCPLKFSSGKKIVMFLQDARISIIPADKTLCVCLQML